MRQIDENLIQEITRTIVERFHPRRIVLFGSHARGDAGPDSDLDLIVEMETSDPLDQAYKIYRTFPLRDWAMDLIVYTPEKFRQDRGVIGTLPSMIEGEARILYADER